MALQMKNFTPFANIRYVNSDSEGRDFGIVIVKMTFDINGDGSCTLSGEQEPLLFSDEHHSNLDESSLRYSSDLVPFKPATDILIDAVAKAPGGEALPAWLCHAELEDQFGTKVEKTIRVTGPRSWIPKWKRALNDDERKNWQDHRHLFVGWELSEPEPIAELPIRYEYAFGGLMPKGRDENGNAVIEAFEHNPAGRGWIDKDWTDHTKPVPAPQIESADDPIADPYKSYEPQGFGPIPPAWLPRRPLGGTYDQAWVDKVWPKWPADYQFSYHNSATAALKSPEKRFLAGAMNFTLINASSKAKTRDALRFDVPPVLIGLSDALDTVETTRLNLDTVHFDLSATDPQHKRIYVSGRTVFKLDTYETIAIHRKQDWMERNGATLHDLFPPSPHPSDVV